MADLQYDNRDDGGYAYVRRGKGRSKMGLKRIWQKWTRLDSFMKSTGHFIQQKK